MNIAELILSCVAAVLALMYRETPDGQWLAGVSAVVLLVILLMFGERVMVTL